MERLVVGAVVLASFLAGCAAKDSDSQQRAELDALRAENDELKQEIEKRRAESDELQREIIARLTSTAAANAKAIEQLRREFRAAQEAAVGQGPAVHPLILDREIEERLQHKVQEIQEAAWQSPPSGCVRVLRAVIDRYPNSRAALRAQGVLLEWGVADVQITDANAAEIDESIRANLRERARLWQEIQGATHAAEQGQTEQAVRVLQRIAQEHPDGPGRQAMEILGNWGLAGLAPEDIEFAEVGPRIQQQAAAQREIEAAFQSLHRGHPEAAAKTFKKLAKKYDGLLQAERALQGLEEALAQIRERERDREQNREQNQENERRPPRRPGEDRPEAGQPRDRNRDAERRDGPREGDGDGNANEEQRRGDDAPIF